jgi:hypothetical protein
MTARLLDAVAAILIENIACLGALRARFDFHLFCFKVNLG